MTDTFKDAQEASQWLDDFHLWIKEKAGIYNSQGQIVSELTKLQTPEDFWVEYCSRMRKLISNFGEGMELTTAQFTDEVPKAIQEKVTEALRLIESAKESMQTGGIINLSPPPLEDPHHPLTFLKDLAPGETVEMKQRDRAWADARAQGWDKLFKNGRRLYPEEEFRREYVCDFEPGQVYKVAGHDLEEILAVYEKGFTDSTLEFTSALEQLQFAAAQPSAASERLRVVVQQILSERPNANIFRELHGLCLTLNDIFEQAIENISECPDDML